jgi:hypothetical protein
MQLARGSCRFLDEYWRAPPSEKGKLCRVGTKASLCHDYMNRVYALQTISHESQHLLGIRDEATAECVGMQRLAWVALGFGATLEQARQMAGDYYRDFYMVRRPGTAYYQPGCPDPSAG